MGFSAHYEILKTSIKCINGSEFIFEGVRNNIKSIKSIEGVDICWVEEAQSVTKNSWDVLIPTIRKDGSEIWITFNPELEEDETYERFVQKPPEGAWVQKVGYDDNPWFPQVLRDEMEETRKRSESDYRHIWLGECKQILEGAYYAEYLKKAEEEGRIGVVPIDPLLRTNVAFDLGISDDTAMVFWQQSPGGQIRVIDYYEHRGVGLEHYVRVLEEKKAQYGLIYGEYVFPHDVQVRELGTGKSRYEMLQGFGIHPTVAPMLPVADGINAVRKYLPAMWIDKDRCAQFIHSMRRYRREFDEKRNVFYEKPLHDAHSHACLDGDSLVKTLRGEIPIRDVVVGDYAWTPAGYALVSASGATKVATEMIEVSLSNGQILLCTPEHKIFTTRGVVVADSLRYNDGVITQKDAPCLLSQKIRFAGYRDAYIESFKGNAIGFGLSETFTPRKLVGDFACFIKRYTERFTAICRAMYDQWTETFATPTPITGRFTELSQNESTLFKRWTEYAFTTNQKGITKPITQNTVASQCTVTFGKSTTEKYPKVFTSITKTETRLTTTYQTLNCCLQKSICLTTQKKASGSAVEQMLNNLSLLAKRPKSGILHRKGLLGTAKMENAHGKTGRGFLETAMNAAGNTLRRIRTGQSSAIKIVKLRRLEGAEASRLVYDLTVEKHHCYLANGFLVSNSDSARYMCISIKEHVSSNPIKRSLKGIV